MPQRTGTRSAAGTGHLDAGAAPRCSAIARELAEPLAATAPAAGGWLLVEHAGPWPHRALDALTDDDPAAAAARRVDAHADTRVLLIRRPRPATGGPPRGADVTGVATRPRTAYLVHTGPGAWCEAVPVTDPRLGELAPETLLASSRPGLGAPVEDPLFLVCTHARRDRCCAILGRPIADTLAALHPATTFACSHLSGHRFAGNLLVMPSGATYGGLDVAGALAAVDATLAGDLHLERLRGRTHLPQPAQAADIWVRRETGLRAPEDVHVREIAHDADGARVTVATPVATYHVRVRHHDTGTPRITSCDATDPVEPGVWVVTGSNGGASGAR